MLSSYLQSIARTLTGTFDFSGRSSRRDVLDYWIASAILLILVDMILPRSLLSWPSREMFALLVYAPLPALVGRRCHDHGRSAVWALALLPPVALKFHRNWELATGPLEHAPTYAIGWAWVLLQIACMLVLFAVILMPGDAGDNRYGAGRYAVDASTP